MVLTGLCARTVGLAVHVPNLSLSLRHKPRTDGGSHWPLRLESMCFASILIERVSFSLGLADHWGVGYKVIGRHDHQQVMMPPHLSRSWHLCKVVSLVLTCVTVLLYGRCPVTGKCTLLPIHKTLVASCLFTMLLWLWFHWYAFSSGCILYTVYCCLCVFVACRQSWGSYFKKVTSY